MSTEAPDPPDMAKRKKKDKHKKNSSYTDNHTKKRKREETEAEREIVPESQPELPRSKKHKKAKGERDAVPNSQPDQQEKKKHKRPLEEAEAVPDSQPEQRPSKKQKKYKDEKLHVPDSQSEQQPPKKQKKHKEHPPIKPAKPAEHHLEEHSPFVQQTTSFYLPLSPCAYRFPLEGLCAEHISPLLLTYHPKLNGVLLSYENPRMSEQPSDGVEINDNQDPKAVLSKSIGEYAVTYVWLTAEFLVFRPKRGTYLEGYVSLQNESILGLVCYNYFNAVIERDKLPKAWIWVEDDDDEDGAELSKKKRRKGGQGGGYFVDGEGQMVEGRLVFKVEDFDATPGSDTGAGTISILGSLISESDKT